MRALRRVFILLAILIAAGLPTFEPGCNSVWASEGFSRIGDLKLANGAWWNGLNPHTKKAYMTGFKDGAFLFSSVAIKDVDQALEMWESIALPSLATYEDIKAIDEFYTDKANLKIPIINAYFHFILKSRGEAFEVTAKRVDDWRKEFNK